MYDLILVTTATAILISLVMMAEKEQ